MVDDVDSFVTAAHLLKERGAYKIYVMATHGLLSAEAPRLIEDSPIDEVLVFVPCNVNMFTKLFTKYYYKCFSICLLPILQLPRT